MTDMAPMWLFKGRMRNKTVRDGKRCNLYLPKALTSEAEQVVAARYGVSLSEVVARLLVREVRHKKGICYQRPRELVPENPRSTK